MKQTISYKTSGVCARQIDLTVEDGIITAAAFTGGCHGNTQGVAALVIGTETQRTLSLCDFESLCLILLVN